MKKIKILILLCLSPYLLNAQNYYKNSPDIYYNMDTVGNILTDNLNLPVMEVINSELLSKIDKCIKNYEKKVILTPDSLGSYFSLTVLLKKEDTSLYIRPIANFYLADEYDNHNLNNKFRPESYQIDYYGSFYLCNYLFTIRISNNVDINFMQQFFRTSEEYMDINIYKAPYLGLYGDTDNYTNTAHHYKIKKNKKGGIYLESNND